MKKFAHGCALALLCLALPAANAGAAAWEISPFARYVTNAEFDFVSDIPEFGGSQVLADQGFAFGAGIGYVPNSQFTFEGEYSYQPTTLILQQSLEPERELSDLTIHKIRGNFYFSAPAQDAPAQPYFLLGLGAAIFDAERGSASKFSWQLGAGVKKMTSDTVGFKLQAAYAPSYLTEDNDGYWCDPFYGCYTYPDPQYLDQWEFSLGIVKRFGNIYR